MNLVKDTSRPVVMLKNWNDFRALLDTGAYFPIWTADENILKDLGGSCIRKEVPFGGFGGETKGNLYVLPNMLVGDLIFSNIHIIACSDLKETPFQLILCATMFRNLIYEIDDKNHKLNINIPDDESYIRNLTIKDSNGRWYVLCNSDYDEIKDTNAEFCTFQRARL